MSDLSRLEVAGFYGDLFPDRLIKQRLSGLGRKQLNIFGIPVCPLPSFAFIIFSEQDLFVLMGDIEVIGGVCQYQF
jgi:hypothetical protein